MALAAVIGAVLLLVALGPNNVNAGDKGSRDGHHCNEESSHDATGQHMLYVTTRHDHLDAYNVSGISDISVTEIGNTFDYLGNTVTIDAPSTAYMVTYTVTSLPGVIELCWADELGLWNPLAMSDGSEDENNDNEDENDDSDDENDENDANDDENNDNEDENDDSDDENDGNEDDDDREVITIGPILLPDPNSGSTPAPKTKPILTPTLTPVAAYSTKATQETTTKSSTSRKSRRAPFDFDTPTPAPTATAIPVIARTASSAPTATPTPTRLRAPSSPAPAPTATPVPAVVGSVNLAPEPTVIPSPTPTHTPGPTAMPTRIPIPIYDSTPTPTPRPERSEPVTFARIDPPTVTPTSQASLDPESAEIMAIKGPQESGEGGISEEVWKGTLVAAAVAMTVMSSGIAAFVVRRRRLFSWSW